MDAATCLCILSSDSGTVTREQRWHAFLATIYSLVLSAESTREEGPNGIGDVGATSARTAKDDQDVEDDGEDDGEEEDATWEKCLLDAHMPHLLELPDFIESVMHLVASWRLWQLTPATALLVEFVSRAQISAALNAHIAAKQLNAVDWMSVANLTNLGLLQPVSYELTVKSASRELALLLQLTNSSWDVQISASFRMRTENIMCVLSKICGDGSQSMPSSYVVEHCYEHLLTLTTRLEDGIVAASQAEVDANGGESEDEEDDDGSDEEDAVFGRSARTSTVINTATRGVAGSDVALRRETSEERPALVDGGGIQNMARLLEHRWREETALPRSRTSWCEMCLTAASRILQTCLIAISNGGESAAQILIKMDMSEYYAMLTSPCWQRQLLALQFIKSAIIIEASGRKRIGGGDVVGGLLGVKQALTADDVRENKKRLGSHEGKGNKQKGYGGAAMASKASVYSTNNAPNVVSVSRRVSQRGPSPIEELCKNGTLRPVCWLLMHRAEAVRLLAGNILQVLVDLYTKEEDGGSSIELCSSLVEQGIVPLLATILSGNSTSTHVEGASSNQRGAAAIYVDAISLVPKFPEKEIRNCIASLLAILAARTEVCATLRSRLSSALHFSGNFALRLNIFTGLVFLLGISPSLGQSLWMLSNQGHQVEAPEIPAVDSASEGSKSQGLVFRLMLNNLCKDPQELKQIIGVLSHILKFSVFLRDKGYISVASSAAPFKANDVSKPSSLCAQTSASLSKMLGGGPTVLVLGDGGLLIKMACPTSNAVLRRSAKLATVLRKLEEVAETKESPEDKQGSDILPGSYAVWQEVFSHTVDDYLLVTSAERMATDAIIDAYHLARRYDIQDLLVRYGSILSKRLTADTIVATLECALGLGKDSFMANNLPLPAPLTVSSDVSPLRATTHYNGQQQRTIHLNLLANCFAFVEKNSASIFSKRFPQRVTELTLLVHQTIEYIMH